MKTFKIYGLRRTGTNYLQWLLQNNCERTIILVDIPIWKHAVPTSRCFDKDYVNRAFALAKDKDFRLSNDIKDVHHLHLLDDIETPINIFCVKNPYSWYLSICKWREINAFPLTNDKLEQLYSWNYTSAKYYNIANDVDNFIVRYEDLLRNPQNILECICRGRGIMIPKFTNLTTKIKSEEEFDRDYYLKRKYVRAYDDADLIRFNKFVDRGVMVNLKYDLEEP